MVSKKKKYVTLMIFSIVLNIVLYCIAHFGHLPLWMDNIGTCYAAMMLEPAAGLLVGFAYNFFEALFIYGPSSIIYYATSAVSAICVGLIVRREGRIQTKRIPLAVGALTVINTIVSATLTIWRTGGIPDSGWERHFQQMMMDGGMSKYLSCYLSAAVLKVFDAIVLIVILFVLYKLTPEKCYNVQREEGE